LFSFLFFVAHFVAAGADKENSTSVYFKDQGNYFSLTEGGVPIPVIVDDLDFKGVHHAVGNLKEDFKRVTGSAPQQGAGKYQIIIGTVGKSVTIDRLIKEGKIAKNDLVGKNEKFIIEVVRNPSSNVAAALVIAGSDKRGTIYGTYELSNQIGVSPWYYWADVPVKKHSELYVKPGKYTQGEPAVKY